MKHEPRIELAIKDVSVAREAWKQAVRPNDDRADFDFEAMNELVLASQAIDSLSVAEKAEACEDILSRFFPPKLSEGELDYSWLCIYWRASEFRSALLALGFELSGFDFRPASEKMAEVEKYHSEIASIREFMSQISTELEVIKKNRASSGISIGAFGISIPIEIVGAAVKRVNQQISPERKTFNISLLAEFTVQLFQSAKTLIGSIGAQSLGASRKLFSAASTLVAAAGKSALVAAGISEREVDLPKLNVKIRINPNLDVQDVVAIETMRNISDRIDALTKTYDVHILDDEFFEILRREFGRFEYLVEVDRNKS